jgi:hypothetical protein
VRTSFVIATFAALVVSTAAIGATSSSDQRLASSLVVALEDVPNLWTGSNSPAHPLVKCVEAGGPRIDTRARSSFGSPNSGVWSFAAVFAFERRATRYYRAALDLVPTCVRHFLRSEWMPHPAYIAVPERLDVGRYGDRSQGWRIRFRSETRRAYDWIVVKTGRAVLVDVFLVAYFDARWRDRTREATGGMWSITIEQTMLRNALARAARS